MLPHFGEDGYSLDRIDNDGNYEPNNVRWANRLTQQNNTRANIRVTYNDENHTIGEWAKKLGINYNKLYGRLRNGWDIEKAFITD